MKRREFIKLTGLGTAGAAIASPAIAQSMPELKWRLTSSFPKSLDTLYSGAELFAKHAGEATDGRFQIQTVTAAIAADLQRYTLLHSLSLPDFGTTSQLTKADVADLKPGSSQPLGPGFSSGMPFLLTY